MEFIEVESVTVLIESLGAQHMKKGNEKKFDVDRLMASMELVVSHLKQGSEKGIRRYSIPSPPKTISSSEIKDIRMKLDVTQPVFAQLIGVSIATAKSWEMGRRAPNATARKLLHVASKNPFILMM